MAGNLTAMIASIFSGGVTADPYFEYTTLLLPGNGTNGAQNNTFLDGSTNNFTITRNGNTTQGTFSPFSQTGWGNYFGSSTSNLKFASSAGFAIGAGNFSIECFVNLTAWSGNQRVCIQGQAGTTNIQIAKDSTSNDLFVDIQGTRVITYAWTPSVGRWYHIALVRSGTGTNQVTLYIDGSSVATGTSSASIAQNQFVIGGIDWAAPYNIQGYISNFRYSNVARTITVPTSPYTSDANTLILTCQSNRFVDNSASPKTITVNGSTSVVAFSPFNPAASWSAATNGGSGYFDGSGDYLSAASNAAFGFGTGDFSIEAWVYRLDTSNHGIFANGPAGNGSLGIYITNNKLQLDFYGGTSITGATTLIANQWYHLAVGKVGSNISLYVNGLRDSTTTTSSNNTSTNCYIGTSWGGSGAWLFGYMSGFRVLKGSSAYNPTNTSISLPTTPPTAITNTSLLLNFTNAGIYDATSKNDLETVGNAQISNAVTPQFGSTSIKFNGTTDYLSAPDGPLFSLGSANFTIECWFRSGSFASGQFFVSQWNSASYGYAFSIANSTTVIFEYYSSGVYTSRSYTVPTFSTNTWYHIAWVRYNGTTTVYIDGVARGTPTSDNVSITDSTRPLLIGINGDGSNQYFDGYIQDLRITTGYARYTANFTPPTAAFPTL